MHLPFLRTLKPVSRTKKVEEVIIYLSYITNGFSDSNSNRVMIMIIYDLAREFCHPFNRPFHLSVISSGCCIFSCIC